MFRFIVNFEMYDHVLTAIDTPESTIHSEKHAHHNCIKK